MPTKSRRSRDRRFSHTKIKKGKQGSSPRVTPGATVTPTGQPLPQPGMPAPTTTMPPHPAKPVVKYPYITTELRRIFILAGVILAILVVLVLVLR